MNYLNKTSKKKHKLTDNQNNEIDILMVIFLSNIYRYSVIFKFLVSLPVKNSN